MVRDKIRLHNTHENCEKIIKKFRFQQKAELSMVDDTGLELRKEYSVQSWLFPERPVFNGLRVPVLPSDTDFS